MLTIYSYISYIHNTQNNKTKVKYISITHVLEVGKLRYNLKDTQFPIAICFSSVFNRADTESKDLDAKLVFLQNRQEKTERK